MKIFEALLILVLNRGILQLINGSVCEQLSLRAPCAKPQWCKDEKDTEPAVQKLTAVEWKFFWKLVWKL